MNKKGSAFTDLFILLAVVMVGVLFFAGIIYGMDLLNERLSDIDITIGSDTNVTAISSDTFGRINTALGGLKWVAMALLFGMMLAIFISNFMVKAHPVFIIVYILITIVAIVFAVYISNAYETMLMSGPLSTTLTTFGPMNFFLLNLPAVIGIIGFGGALFLFIGITVDREQGGSLM